MCRPGLSVPLPKAWSTRGTKPASCLNRHWYSGAYLASTSSVGLAVAARLIRLFRLAYRKFVRSPLAVVTEEYRLARFCFWSANVLLVVVRSDSALIRSGAALV